MIDAMKLVWRCTLVAVLGTLACFTILKLYKMCAIKGWAPGAQTHTFRVTQKLADKEDGDGDYWIGWTQDDISRRGNYRIYVPPTQWKRLQVGDPILIVTVGNDPTPYLKDDVFTEPGNFAFDLVLLSIELAGFAFVSRRLARQLREREVRIAALGIRRVGSSAILFIVVLMTGAGTFLFIGSQRLPTSTPYGKEVASARIAGVPVTAQALQVALPPPKQNAALVYTKLLNLLKSHPLDHEDQIGELLAATPGPSEAQLNRARKVLAGRPELLRLIHQAADRPHCVFVRDWSDPFAVKLPEDSTMREAAWILVAESELLAYRGEPLPAVKNLGLGFRIGRQIETLDHLNGYVSAISIDAITIRGLQKVLTQFGGDSEVADAARAVIEREWRPHSLALAIQRQAGADVVELRAVRIRGPGALLAFLGEKSSRPLHANLLQWDSLIDENGLIVLRHERKLVSLADLPYLQSMPAEQGVRRDAESDKNPLHGLLQVFLFRYGDFAARRAAIQAQAEITRSAAAVMAWKARKGSFPLTLAEAITPVPIDPFDGQPLRYRRQEAGFVISSVGRSAADKGAPIREPGPASLQFHCSLPP